MKKVGFGDVLPNKIFTGGASSLNFQPKGIATTSGVVLVPSSDAIAVFSEGTKTSSLSVKYAPTKP